MKRLRVSVGVGERVIGGAGGSGGGNGNGTHNATQHNR